MRVKLFNCRFRETGFYIWRIFFVAIAFFMIIIPTKNSLAADNINKQLTYFGVLKSSDGGIVDDGNYDMVFRLYSSSSGDSVLWTGTHTAANGNAVEVKDGNFVAFLGSGTGNTINLSFNDGTYYVGVTVGTDSEMNPRQGIGASAYTFNADTVDGSHIIKTTTNPEGLETGSVGDIALDTTNNKLYVKTSGTDTSTGWSEIVGSGGVTTLSGLTDSTISSLVSGDILVYDGTDSWDNKTLSGDATINAFGILTIAADSVALGSDTTGNYVQSLADAGSGDLTITNGATEGGTATIDIVDDALDFSEFSDTLTVDATTTFNLDTNAADMNFDSNTLFIDSSANRVGIGTVTPSTTLDVAGLISATGLQDDDGDTKSQ